MGPQWTQFLAHVLCRFLAGAACLSQGWASGLRGPRWLSCLGPSEDVLWGPEQARVAAVRWGDVGWPCPRVCSPFHTWRPRLGRGQLTEVWLCLALALVQGPDAPRPPGEQGAALPRNQKQELQPRQGGSGARSPQSSFWPRGLPGPAHSFSPGVPFRASFPIFSVYVTHAVRWAEIFPSGHLEGCQPACGRDALGSPTWASPGQSLLAPPPPTEFWAGQLCN